MWYKECDLLFMIILVIFQVEGQRGRSCHTPNGESATCMSIYDCSNLLKVIGTSDLVQLRFLRESQCGHESIPLVCCGTATTFTRNSLIPTRASCGFQETDKIFDGQETALDEFPWMVLLQYTNTSGYKRWSCGGTLISSRYVLTAAHCVSEKTLVRVGRLTSVRLGEYNTETDIDCKSARNCNQRPVDARVDEVIPHLDFDDNNQNIYYDIALIRINRAVRYTNYIRPICLPESNEAARVGEQVFVAGWGRTEIRNSSPIKLKVGIPIADRDKCTKQFSKANIVLRDSQICAGGQRGRDSCSGDSGGPLMKTSKSDNSQWYQEGIVSFGNTCGSEWPGIYTRVADYLPWIHSTVRN